MWVLIRPERAALTPRKTKLKSYMHDQYDLYDLYVLRVYGVLSVLSIRFCMFPNRTEVTIQTVCGKGGYALTLLTCLNCIGFLRVYSVVCKNQKNNILLYGVTFRFQINHAVFSLKYNILATDVEDFQFKVCCKHFSS